LLVRDTVRDFVRTRIVPNADAWNEKGEFPLDLLPELAALGLTGLAVPQEYGGAELDMLTSALVMEELGAGDGSIALTVAAHNSLCIGHLLAAANEDQKDRWLPPLARGEYLGCWALTEPASGSDAVSVQSRLRREGDDYVLTGTKQFITNGGVAGFAVVLIGAGDRRLTAFGVPRASPGFRPGRRGARRGAGSVDQGRVEGEAVRVGGRHGGGGFVTAGARRLRVPARLPYRATPPRRAPHGDRGRDERGTAHRHRARDASRRLMA